MIVVVVFCFFFFFHIKVQKDIVHEVKDKHDYCSVIEYGLGSVNIVWVFMEFLYFGYLE